MHDDFLDAGFAQQVFHLGNDIGVFILIAEQRPDDAVEDRFAVTRAKADAVLFETLVVEGADHHAQ